MKTQQQIMMTIIKSLPLFDLPRLFRLSTNGIILAVVLTYSSIVSANVNSVVVSPTNSVVPMSQQHTLTLTWQVSRTELIATGTRLVSSPAAMLQVNGNNIGSVGGALSTSSTLVRGVSGTVTLSETISLSATQIKAIAASPAGQTKVIRTFTDTQSSLSSNMTLFAASANVGELEVDRIDLSFNNQSRTDIVKQGETLGAVAEITFSSSGILRGEWRLIDPTTSYGSQSGRVLQVIRQPLVSSGQGRSQIMSPQLPTQQTGLYLLAFYVEQDDQIEIPVLRYFVIEDDVQEQINHLPPITTFSPAANALLDDDTQFSWAAVVDATAYQVELFSTQQQVPLTGKLVPATQLELKLSMMSLDWLMPATQYFWQVKALSAQGQVLAVSPKQAIQLP